MVSNCPTVVSGVSGIEGGGSAFHSMRAFSLLEEWSGVFRSHCQLAGCSWQLLWINSLVNYHSHREQDFGLYTLGTRGGVGQD